MDTLIYSSSLFLIPIQIAAYKKEYILMNVYICLLLTSWAHHSNIHIIYNINNNINNNNINNNNNNNSNNNQIYIDSIYDILDTYMCYFSIYYTYMYAMLFCTTRQCIIYLVCLFSVFVNYYFVNKNKNYLTRGITNWHYHIHHILMHISACIGFIAILV